jgi:hypothetical protein
LHLRSDRARCAWPRPGHGRRARHSASRIQFRKRFVVGETPSRADPRGRHIHARGCARPHASARQGLATAADAASEPNQPRRFRGSLGKPMVRWA